MPQHRPQRKQPSLLAWLNHVIRLIRNYVLHRQDARHASHALAEHARPAAMRQELVSELLAALEALDARTAEEAASGMPSIPPASSSTTAPATPATTAPAEPRASSPSEQETESVLAVSESMALLTDEERALIHRIHHETETANRNNLTRTEAYRAVYYRSPELQWALLAHLVSRNGGWNMTDLKGELIPKLLDDASRTHAFMMLERINSLIFHDAYPQLLLYEASCREGTDLSRLLPYFGVSRFMLPVWRQFWQRRDSVLLTTALIVNEQHVIERPIVRSEHFRAHVLKRAPFLLQIPLQTNTVVMPYGSPLDSGGEMMLAGLVLEDFSDVKERVEFGKRLYAILLAVPEVMEGVMAFVRGVHHSGSRADYAPHLFTKERTGRREDDGYQARLEGCKLTKAAAGKLYSPDLQTAWADVQAKLPERTDWFESADAVGGYFEALPMPDVFEITFEHCMAFNKLELAVEAKQRFGSHGKTKGTDAR